MALYLAKKGKNKGQRSVNEQGKVNLSVFYLCSDIRNILKGILAPARLVPSRNTREVGISSLILIELAMQWSSNHL